MATKYAENLLSTRYLKGTLEDITWNYQGLVTIAQAPGAEQDSNIQVRRKLAEVKLHLARANSLFHNREFQKALDEYKVTQGLVYGLIQPSFNPDLSLNPTLTLPLQTVNRGDPRPALRSIHFRTPLFVARAGPASPRSITGAVSRLRSLRP